MVESEDTATTMATMMCPGRFYNVADTTNSGFSRRASNTNEITRAFKSEGYSSKARDANGPLRISTDQDGFTEPGSEGRNGGDVRKSASKRNKKERQHTGGDAQIVVEEGGSQEGAKHKQRERRAKPLCKNIVERGQREEQQQQHHHADKGDVVPVWLVVGPFRLHGWGFEMAFLAPFRAFSSAKPKWLWNNSSLTVVESAKDYRDLRLRWYKDAKTVGFIPTMGALHEGHLDLVSQARQRCDIVVSSIFVNPAQFSPTEDLSRYPRTLDNDLALLHSRNCDVVFYPSVDEMYPAGINLDVSKQFGSEGSIRPHFFRGVATVVSKLFNVIQPTHAYFGQKDAQQCVVVRRMIQDLLFPIELVVGDTVRETDGLAMSSRNRYLNPDERRVAPLLYQALSAGLKVYELEMARGIKRIKRETVLNAAYNVLDEGLANSGVTTELQYLSLADNKSLSEVNYVEPKEQILFSGALKIGKTRIIDNILIN
ncbi:hypothetical protein HK096_001311 [Nowakowskiella sp. JEL0078]|nr:hypothetical protein HK096_001311 [Nowakowskiella sp. JEL0078]